MLDSQVLHMIIALRMLSNGTTNESTLPLVRFDDSETCKLQLSEANQRAEALKNLGYNVLVLGHDASTETVQYEIGIKHIPEIIIWPGYGTFFCGTGGSTLESLIQLSKQNKAKNTQSSSSQCKKRLQGCVAAVTGSAQGFGAGIAEELAKEGANVVITDLNEQLGQAFCRKLNELYGAGTSVFCAADVTNLESLASLAECSVRSFGGIDMFISNAGVLKAGSISEMDERSFDLVTNVNYKAFFLCTKSIAPIMKLQNKFNKNHFMDIIQINSKSGLQGSNKNFAYAGSKFGSIGLTQSFAMELVDSNIKVNSICPGNYFEGPLWSDPEKGLFVQYLRAGKVPGAQSIEDVKKFYTDKVPMKRGCNPEDVAKAIFYIHDQLYETGQAIPVTGGQVMLN